MICPECKQTWLIMQASKTVLWCNTCRIAMHKRRAIPFSFKALYQLLTGQVQ